MRLKNSLSPQNETYNFLSFFFWLLDVFCDIFQDLVLKLWSATPPPTQGSSLVNLMEVQKQSIILLLGYNVLIERASRKNKVGEQTTHV
jgi:hypothetical protein